MAVTVLLSTLVLTLPSAARDLQLSFSPNAATWRDAVVVTVTGPAPFCTPELGDPEISFDGGWFVDIDLIDLCTIGPPVPDGSFSVSTSDPSSAGQNGDGPRPRPRRSRARSAARALTIHRGADLELTAIEPASSAQPFRFEIEGVGACPTAEVSLPAPFVVRATYDGNCQILPPGEVRFTLPLQTANPLPPGEYELQVLDFTRAPSMELPEVVTKRVKVWNTTRWVPSATSRCLERGRFRITAHFRDFQGRTGDAKALPTTLDDTGLFWFFTPDNVELTIEVLNACRVNGRFWVFRVLHRDRPSSTRWW